MALSTLQTARRKERIKKIALVGGAIAVVAIIIWIDIATNLWQNLVILAGLAAGVVTFILTVLIVDKVIARSTAKRWEPVTHLALTEILHNLSDEEKSEITRGQIVPRELSHASLNRSEIEGGTLTAEHFESLERLRENVHEERRQLQQTLGTWAQFLVSSEDTEGILLLAARVAGKLDGVRDQTLVLETAPSPEANTQLESAISDCNDSFKKLVAELESQLHLFKTEVMS